MPRQKIFSVIEYASHFEIRHNASGKQHHLSDGVDAVFTPAGRPMSPGAKGFVAAWERSFNSVRE